MEVEGKSWPDVRGNFVITESLKEKNECLPWTPGGGTGRSCFSSDLSSATWAGLPVLGPPRPLHPSVLFGSERVFMLLGWALEGE